LDVTSFKPFKNAFKKVRDNVIAKSKYLEPNKVTLIEWVDKALQQSLKKENIKIRVQGL
jgi:tRNA A37 threonylcarbamoyladenosine biosynthesis protein TsaE